MMANINLTSFYLERTVDSRMLSIIDERMDACNTILDLACGSGLYGKFLRSKCNTLLGFDYDPGLCENARKLSYYSEVFCDDISNLRKHVRQVDEIFCSEFLEHIPNDKLPKILRDVESICRDRIIYTVPNPISPHYRYDPSHVGEYNIYSMLKRLNASKNFAYKLYAIGFSDLNLRKPVFKPFRHISKRFSIFSPTVLYIGNRKQ